MNSQSIVWNFKTAFKLGNIDLHNRMFPCYGFEKVGVVVDFPASCAIPWNVSDYLRERSVQENDCGLSCHVHASHSKTAMLETCKISPNAQAIENKENARFTAPKCMPGYAHTRRAHAVASLETAGCETEIIVPCVNISCQPKSSLIPFLLLLSFFLSFFSLIQRSFQFFSNVWGPLWATRVLGLKPCPPLPEKNHVGIYT